MRYDDAEISKFPLNPLTAIGAHAESRMEHNIEGDLPTAHGPNSAWAYCAEHDAWNIGIGVDLKDYLTIFHVSQEVPAWPVRTGILSATLLSKKVNERLLCAYANAGIDGQNTLQKPTSTMTFRRQAS